MSGVHPNLSSLNSSNSVSNYVTAPVNINDIKIIELKEIKEFELAIDPYLKLVSLDITADQKKEIDNFVILLIKGSREISWPKVIEICIKYSKTNLSNNTPEDPPSYEAIVIDQIVDDAELFSSESLKHVNLLIEYIKENNSIINELKEVIIDSHKKYNFQIMFNQARGSKNFIALLTLYENFNLMDDIEPKHTKIMKSAVKSKINKFNEELQWNEIIKKFINKENGLIESDINRKSLDSLIEIVNPNDSVWSVLKDVVLKASVKFDAENKEFRAKNLTKKLTSSNSLSGAIKVYIELLSIKGKNSEIIQKSDEYISLLWEELDTESILWSDIIISAKNAVYKYQKFGISGEEIELDDFIKIVETGNLDEYLGVIKKIIRTASEKMNYSEEINSILNTISLSKKIMTNEGDIISDGIVIDESKKLDELIKVFIQITQYDLQEDYALRRDAIAERIEYLLRNTKPKLGWRALVSHFINQEDSNIVKEEITEDSLKSLLKLIDQDKYEKIKIIVTQACNEGIEEINKDGFLNRLFSGWRLS